MSSTANSKRFVTLIDPAYKAGMLQIPIEKTSETKGRNEWLKGILRKDLSLCCLFQKGRCHAEERCHQVHVDRVYMESLRAQQAKIVSCCSRCNDTASLTPAALNFFATHFGGSTKVCVSCTDNSDAVNDIDSDRVAYTTGLVSFIEQARKSTTQQGTVTLSGKKVCRLHLRAACKYGKDCKNIHLCSKLTESILAAPTQPAKKSVTQPTKPAAKTQQQNNGIAGRALPQPVCIATVAAPSATPSKKVESSAPTTPKPLPSFSMFSRPVGQEKGSLHLSCSEGHLDAVDVNEHSGKLSGIIFDPKKALEESQKAGALRFDFNSTDAAWFGATSPGQKRRGSNSSNGTTASYDGSSSLTNEWNPLSAGSAGQMDFLRIFS